VGARVPRVEDDRLLTGRGVFVGDVRLPGLLHAAFVRSTLPHARLAAVDVTSARAGPGVAAVFTAADLVGRAGEMRLGAPPTLARPAYRALADDKVRFVGDPVALVVAASRALAEDAAERVEVDYEALAAVVTLDAALDPASPPLFDDIGTNVLYREHREHGDPDGAFAHADHVVTLTFRQRRQANVPMEGRGGVADYRPATGELVYHAAHQNPHALHVELAQLLDLPAERLHVRCGDIGGSFGQKAYVSREDVAVCAAAVALGRPVAWIEDRSENLLAAGHARDEELTVDAAVTADGVVLGLAVRMTLDEGAYQLSTLPSTIVPTIVRVLLPGPYRIEHLRFDATVVATNKATYVAYRGPWEAETWVRERLLDVIARRLDLEPLEVRRRNLLRAADFPRRMITGPTMESVTAAETLEAAAALVDLPAFRDEQRAARAQGRYLGFGLATVLEPAPGPPDYGAAIGAGAAPRSAQRAVARLERDGTVTVLTSQSPHGHGHQTTLAQLAADRLDVGLDAIRVVHGDTRYTPFNRVGTGGSRAATLASGAVLGAIDELADQAMRVTAQHLEASRDDLELRAGRVQVRGTPAAGRTLTEIAALAETLHADTGAASGAPPGIEATFDFAIPNGGWSQATHCAWVAVDLDTGLVEIVRYLVVEDCGAMINPAIVEGQIRGGVAQGIAGVLYEWFAYDGDGQPRTASLVDYLLPTAVEIPTIEIVHLESPPQGPLDFRGVGEGGAIGAPAALTNAIEDALAPFGVTVTDQYLPPTRILELAGRLA
jgi:carbon-monoxide dehydrogenase large subunit